MKTNIKTLIIYMSFHHNNTRKVLNAIRPILNADLKTPSELTESDLKNYDLIGLASGTIYGMLHRSILDFISHIELPNKKYFIITTSGMKMKGGNNAIAKAKKLLEDNNKKVIGTFDCRGWDSWGPLKLIGGIKKEHPTPEDLNAAKIFTKNLLKK